MSKHFDERLHPGAPLPKILPFYGADLGPTYIRFLGYPYRIVIL